jgi:hypothetical protein
MLRENILTSHLLNTLQQGKIKKIVRSRTTSSKRIELRREVGNNSFFADILISLSPRDKEVTFFDNQKTRFIAIEVKISDWRQGLYQAWRYYSFAEESYLAIYKDFSKNIDLNEFKKYNVGLIVFDESNIKILHHPVKKSNTKDKYRKEMRETIWRRSLAIESVQPVI